MRAIIRANVSLAAAFSSPDLSRLFDEDVDPSRSDHDPRSSDLDKQRTDCDFSRAEWAAYHDTYELLCQAEDRRDFGVLKNAARDLASSLLERTVSGNTGGRCVQLQHGGSYVFSPHTHLGPIFHTIFPCIVPRRIS